MHGADPRDPGRATTALLLPGMTLNATVFPTFQIPTVAVDFTRLVLGRDGWSADLERRRMAIYAELLTARLRAEATWIGAARRVVVAHSFGGMLALTWLLGAAGDPIARIDGLVLIATTAGPMFGTARVRLASLGGRDLRIPATALLPLWNLRLVTRAMSALAGRGSEPGSVDFRSLANRSDVAVGLAGWRNTDWRARRSFRFAMAGFDVRSRLGDLNVPAIVLHGGRDSFFSMETGEVLARGLPHAELRAIPEAAHLLPLTHPEAVLEAVRDVLAG
jgi:pimeloyl-ACP methyl ester carboxylesterase